MQNTTRCGGKAFPPNPPADAAGTAELLKYAGLSCKTVWKPWGTVAGSDAKTQKHFTFEIAHGRVSKRRKLAEIISPV